ncbi:MAG: ubiquinol oxidase subunit II [Gammaproteobacteria bacterium]|nr:ubiquinol oxidase subunit II [Gammaproteobacteria bacterium]
MFTIGSALVLSGCKMAILNPMGPIAAQEKHLMIVALLLMLIIVIPVIIITFVIAYKYRASNTKAKYLPEFSHSAKLEAIWWGIPIIIIAFLGSVTWRSTHTLDPYRPLDSKVTPITIQVVALEWRWLFIYPQQHIATMNFVEFPANTPVNFVITSDAPMNSFMIQQLAGQIYAMAGMQTQMHLMADKPGDYYGRSVSFSGDGFANMQFIARAAPTAAAFNQWVKSVQNSPNNLTMASYTQLVPASKDTSVIEYSNVVDGLFGKIMMKYMMPMPAVVPPQKATINTQYNSDRDYHHHRDLINPVTNKLIKG